MDFIGVKEAAARWGISPRRVQVLCNDGRIEGAQRVGNVWVIPGDAEKPGDARRKKSTRSRCGGSQIDRQLIGYLKQLPAQYWDFREDDTHEFTHGIHSYPAMMVSPISRNIIGMMQQLRPIHALMDPFAGSGTVLVEGMLAGIPEIYGNDINPLALLLCKVKTTVIPPRRLQSACRRLYARLDRLYREYDPILCDVDAYLLQECRLDPAAKDGWGCEAPKHLAAFYQQHGVSLAVPDFKNIGYWFRPRPIVELSLIKAAILEERDEDIRDFFFVAMSEIIRLVSNRRNGEFKMFRMPPDKVRAFAPDTRGEFIKTLERNVQKMNDFAGACAASGSPSQVRVLSDNACALTSAPEDFFDLIVTSPPYGDSRTTVAYGEYSRLSLQWINRFDWSEREIMDIDRSLMGGRKYKSGFDLTLSSPTLAQALEPIKATDLARAGDVFSFYEDLDRSIAAIARKTRRGGYQFWVVGNRTVKNQLLQTDVIITELARGYGLTHVYTIDRNIPNKVMPARNSPTNVTGATSATMTMEHIVVLRKN